MPSLKHFAFVSGKHKSSTRHSRSKKHSSKRHISNSQKEERKKKLKDIATKEKDPIKINDSLSSTSKPEVNVKVTSSNRGAFLTESTSSVLPTKRKDSPQKCQKTSDKDKQPAQTSRVNKLQTDTKSSHDIENKHKDIERRKKDKDIKTSKHKTSSKESNKGSNSKGTSEVIEKPFKRTVESRVPLKNLKPLTDSDDTYTGKPISKVEPLPIGKPKKKVTFCPLPPKVKIFQIEEGNQMKKTSMVKSTMLDVPQMPIFSLEKISLMKILRWNPHWLTEQINNNEPPPILGHNNTTIAVLHSFKNHTQYVQ